VRHLSGAPVPGDRPDRRSPPPGETRAPGETGAGQAGRGGVLWAWPGTAAEVLLASARLTCPGCLARVRSALSADSLVAAVGSPGPGRLRVRCTAQPDRWRRHGEQDSTTRRVAQVARRALEADPHNPAPVTVRYTPPVRCAPPV
jgi:hypothetical protein